MTAAEQLGSQQQRSWRALLHGADGVRVIVISRERQNAGVGAILYALSGFPKSTLAVRR